MALYQKWGVKTGFTFALQFFMIISDGLGCCQMLYRKSGDLLGLPILAPLDLVLLLALTTMYERSNGIHSTPSFNLFYHSISWPWITVRYEREIDELIYKNMVNMDLLLFRFHIFRTNF